MFSLNITFQMRMHLNLTGHLLLSQCWRFSKNSGLHLLDRNRLRSHLLDQIHHLDQIHLLAQNLHQNHPLGQNLHRIHFLAHNPHQNHPLGRNHLLAQIHHLRQIRRRNLLLQMKVVQVDIHQNQIVALGLHEHLKFIN